VPKRLKNFSFRGCIRRTMADASGPTVPPYAARRGFARSCPSTADDYLEEEKMPLSTSNI